MADHRITCPRRKRVVDRADWKKAWEQRANEAALAQLFGFFPGSFSRPTCATLKN
jgi:hypothetical protein